MAGWRQWGRVVALGLAASVGACDSPATPRSGAVFVVEVEGERFRVLLQDDARVAQARRILSGVESQKVVNGELVAGHGGFNTGWSWHMAPETVHFADAAIEVCDGRPSMVEDDLDYWLNTVGRYCPWRAHIVAEEQA